MVNNNKLFNISTINVLINIHEIQCTEATNQHIESKTSTPLQQNDTCQGFFIGTHQNE